MTPPSTALGASRDSAQEGAWRGRLLVLDDDPDLCDALARSLRRRGFEVRTAGSVNAAEALVDAFLPTHAVVDLRLPGRSGLEAVAVLRARLPALRIVVLTGYASIATAIEAIKLGATHYLSKPTDAEEILAAFDRAEGSPDTQVSGPPISVQRKEWELIQSTLVDCAGNISEAARRLGLHRRTLQRKLKKRPSGG